MLGTSMPRSPIWTSWIAELGLLPHNLPQLLHINASEDKEKNVKTIGSIIFEDSQAEKEGL